MLGGSTPQESTTSEKCDPDTDASDEDQPADDQSDDDYTETDQSDDDEIDWKKVDWTQVPNVANFDNVPLRASVCPPGSPPGNIRPIDYFSQFFDNDIIELIVTQSNIYGAQQQSRNWEPVSVEEIKAFLGITVLMGLKPLPRVDLHWSTDPFYRTDEIASTMPHRRFKKIVETLHLNDNRLMPSRNDKHFDKLYKVRPLLDLLNAACQRGAKPSSSQSIDESMILFKGRSSLKQYMPLKPIKRGYKVWTRADSETGYVFEFEIYTGKRDDKSPTIGLGANVVKTLTQKLIDENFHGHIAFDSFFTTHGIMQYLFDHGIYATATVNNNRSDLPMVIKKHKSKSKPKMRKRFMRGDYKWRLKKNVAFIMWQDSKMVTLLTTAFHPKTQKATCTRKQHDGTRKTIVCPKAILEYTKRMGGVDRFDQKRSTYEVSRRSKKWWMRIFYFCFDLAITNAFLLYTSTRNVRSRMSQMQFRLKLARDLIGNFTFRKRKLQSEPLYLAKKSKPSNYQKETARGGVPDSLRFSDVGSHQLERLPSYRRCRQCSTKTKNKRSKIQCSKCKVSLCVTPCFDLFHAERN